jgi:HSP20 family protein
MTLLMKPEPFSQDVSRLFNTLFEPATANGSQRWTPAMDLVEAEDHFVLKADLPGVSEGDVSIEVQDNVLTISGERRAEHERKERGWYRIERAFGRFSRSLSLPEGVDADSVTASFDRGVLEVRVPKPEQKLPKKIEIAVEGTASDSS